MSRGTPGGKSEAKNLVATTRAWCNKPEGRREVARLAPGPRCAEVAAGGDRELRGGRERRQGQGVALRTMALLSRLMFE